MADGLFMPSLRSISYKSYLQGRYGLAPSKRGASYTFEAGCFHAQANSCNGVHCKHRSRDAC